MKRLIYVVAAGSSALVAMGRRAAETVSDIRDAAEVGPDTLRLLDAESPRGNEALAWRVRQILGPRNDDTRAVTDLIDDLCEELDRYQERARGLYELVGEAVDLLEGARDGSYKPDSFTSQPYRMEVEKGAP